MDEFLDQISRKALVEWLVGAQGQAIDLADNARAIVLSDIRRHVLSMPSPIGKEPDEVQARSMRQLCLEGIAHYVGLHLEKTPFDQLSGDLIMVRNRWQRLKECPIPPPPQQNSETKWEFGMRGYHTNGESGRFIRNWNDDSNDADFLRDDGRIIGWKLSSVSKEADKEGERA